jgi:hypothetical protein
MEDSSASAAIGDTPGRSRPNAHSQEPWARLARGLSCGCIIAGAHASIVRPVYRPRKAGGATPMMVNG